jgi:2-polyprenyl-3-methyl-5-hydroxy-6-metoxy-1,4-benzoquinol methylase
VSARSPLLGLPRRIARGIGVRARRLPMTIGVRPYVPIDRATVADWDSDYATGAADAYGDLVDLARYSLLIGYLRHLGPGLTILDVGCGAGLLRERMGELAFPRYVGIDPSAEAIARAQRLADERTTFLHTVLPLEEHGPFDVVVCNEVLYVVPDPRAAIDDLHGAVRPGGHLLVSIWSHPGDRALFRLLEKRFELVDSVFARNAFRRRGNRVSLYARR